MPTAFPSVGHSGSQSISLLTQSTTSTEEQDKSTSSVAASRNTAISQLIVLQANELDETHAVAADNQNVAATNKPNARQTVARPATNELPKNEPISNQSAPMHRLAEVRAQQGLSLRTISRRTGIEVKELKQQEAAGSDLLLSQLIAWQKALEVPLVDLLEDENQTLSRPVQERAKMVRIMKTVVSLCEVSASQPRLSRLSTMLREQVLDLMPELAEIGGWPQCGSRRGADVMGRIFHEPISVELGGLD